MKRVFKKRRGSMSGDMSLNITSMADIFTIILVFLLKSYATASVDINPTAGLKLPQAEASDGFIEALKVEITENAVMMEGKPIVPLKTFGFEASDKLADGTSQQLNKALNIVRKRQEIIAKANSDVKLDSKVIIVADQRAPYLTIKTVLASAAVNGYTDYKLAVVRRGD